MAIFGDIFSTGRWSKPGGLGILTIFKQFYFQQAFDYGRSSSGQLVKQTVKNQMTKSIFPLVLGGCGHLLDQVSPHSPQPLGHLAAPKNYF